MKIIGSFYPFSSFDDWIFILTEFTDENYRVFFFLLFFLNVGVPDSRPYIKKRGSLYSITVSVNKGQAWQKLQVVLYNNPTTSQRKAFMSWLSYLCLLQGTGLLLPLG